MLMRALCVEGLLLEGFPVRNSTSLEKGYAKLSKWKLAHFYAHICTHFHVHQISLALKTLSHSVFLEKEKLESSYA